MYNMRFLFNKIPLAAGLVCLGCGFADGGEGVPPTTVGACGHKPVMVGRGLESLLSLSTI